MEISRTFRVAFLVTVYLSALAFADINEDKKNAIKKVDAQYASVQKHIDNTKNEVTKRSGNIKVIVKYWRQFGDRVFADGNVKIQKTAKTGFLMAELLKSPANVVKCIQIAEREALEDLQADYKRSFVMILVMLEGDETEAQQRVIKYWEGDVKRANDYYAEFREKTKEAINAAKNTSAISTAVKEFTISTNRMVDYVVEIYRNLDKIHLNLVDYIMTYTPLLAYCGVIRNDHLAEELHKCFSKY